MEHEDEKSDKRSPPCDSSSRLGDRKADTQLQVATAHEEATSSVPLVVLSSRFKHASTLSPIANPGVAMVYYKYESTSLEALLDGIGRELNGRRAMTIALLMYGQPGYVKINKQKSVTVQKLKEDGEVRQFFARLTEDYLDQGGPLARVDLLQSSLVQNDEGVRALQELKAVMKVPVHASVDILGGYVSDPSSTSSIRIGTLFFDQEKLHDWMMQSDKDARALYEKMWVEGTGAHGRAVVYRKRDDNSFVILKEVNIMALSKAQRVRALNEVAILSRLNHPSVISYYDSFEEDGSLKIEMEYAERGTLAKYLSNLERPMSQQEMLTMFVQMVDAINYIHKERILHRDLKTANIFLNNEGMVKLGDFGISKILSTGDQNADTVLGTPYYISPEICKNQPYNTKSDIWSLGCILYEMACGRRTFEGTNLGAIVNKIVMGMFEPLPELYSKEFSDLVSSMLVVDPEGRPSAEELLAHHLPPLMAPYIEDLMPTEDPGEKGTGNTRSFLYLLDHSLRGLLPVSLNTKTKLEQVSVGWGHLVVRTADHTVLSWGESGRGQLGHGDTAPRATPTVVEALKDKKITKVECGGEFSVFVSDNGIILTCGRGDHGALGHGATEDLSLPKLIKSFISTSVLTVACGEAHVVAIATDNEIFSWGDGGSGRLGNGLEESRSSPASLDLHEPIETVRCGMDGTMFLTAAGTLLACGSNQYNKLGLNERVSLRMQLKKLLGNVEHTEVSHKLVPTPVKELKKHRVVAMALGPTHSAILVSSGCVYGFGRKMEGQVGAGSLATGAGATILQKPFMVMCSELSTLAVLENSNDINKSFVMWGSPSVMETPVTSYLTGSATPCTTTTNGNHDNVVDSSGDSSEPVRLSPKSLVGVKDPPPTLAPIKPTQLPSSEEPPLTPLCTNYLQDLLARLPSVAKETGRDRDRGKRAKKSSGLSTATHNSCSSIDATQQTLGFLDGAGRPCDPCVRGWSNARLSQLASFGPALLVLLEAEVPDSPDHAHSTIQGAELGAVAFKVNPKLRRVPRWASGYFSGTRTSTTATPLPRPLGREDVVVAMDDYLDNTTTDESLMRTWLKDVMADAIAEGPPLSPSEKPPLPLGLPLGLPAIVHQPPGSSPTSGPTLKSTGGGHLATGREGAESPAAVSGGGQRKRSVSNDESTIQPSFQLAPPGRRTVGAMSGSMSSSTLPRSPGSSGGHHPSVRRHQSHESLVAAANKTKSLPRAFPSSAGKSLLSPLTRSGSPRTLAPVWGRKGAGGGVSPPKGQTSPPATGVSPVISGLILPTGSSPNGRMMSPSNSKSLLSSDRSSPSSSHSESAGENATPTSVAREITSPTHGGRLSLPAIVPAPGQGDSLLLRNKRSNSGSQVLSPTLIHRMKELRRSSHASHGPAPLVAKRNNGGHFCYPAASDSNTTTDDEVVIVTSRPPSRMKLKLSPETMTTSEDSTETEVDDSEAPPPKPLPSSSSDEVFADNKSKPRSQGVKVNSARSHPPSSAKKSTPTKRSPYLSRVTKQPRSSSAKSSAAHSGPAPKPRAKEGLVASEFAERLELVKKMSAEESVQLRQRIELLEREKNESQERSREERRRKERESEERRRLEQKIAQEKDSLRKELDLLKNEVREYKSVVSKLHEESTRPPPPPAPEERASKPGRSKGASAVATAPAPAPPAPEKTQSKLCSVM